MKSREETMKLAYRSWHFTEEARSSKMLNCVQQPFRICFNFLKRMGNSERDPR
ncbi:hypothetical protein NC652_037669 [Populus alba x Populus x berolinensis]|nr:hypothetical protein NC652_037669 [Populus alba x Populus x berolinensis]